MELELERCCCCCCYYNLPVDIQPIGENCGKSKDYTIANSGPIVRFRSDNIVVVWDF
jgi:hypothetical protein